MHVPNNDSAPEQPHAGGDGILEAAPTLPTRAGEGRNKASRWSRMLKVGAIARLATSRGVLSVLVLALALLSTIGSAKAQGAYNHPADCWVLNRSGYSGSYTGSNPTTSDLRAAMATLATTYTVPIEIIAAVAYQETGMYQYGSDAFLIHNLTECRYAYSHNGLINANGASAPPGLGLMQLTSSTASPFDKGRLVREWRYNLEAGVQILRDKYNLAIAGDPQCLVSLRNQTASKTILENWYYALQYYNGTASGSTYIDSIYSLIATPPTRLSGFFPPVTITKPGTVIPGFTNAQGFCAQANGAWINVACNSFSGSVHVSSSFSSTNAPTITNVQPGAPVATGAPQPFTINGTNLASDATVNLYSSSGSYPNRTVSSRTGSTQIVINPNFGTIADNWSVEVQNGSAVSNRFIFSVVLQDSTPPAITAFSVSPTGISQGSSTTISYTVTDSGGSGFNRVELWRTTDNGGAPNNNNWAQVGPSQSASGNGPVSGTFTDAPSAGIWWYGVHAVDGAGNVGTEQTSGRQSIRVTVSNVTYTINVSASPGGAVSGGGTYTSGSFATVSATAAAGYTFVNWTEGGTVVSSSATYTFPVTANRALVANFTAVPVNYTITVSASPAAGGTVTGGGTYASGSTRTVTATENSGYSFTKWTENGSVVSTSAGYTFTLTGNRTLVANFTAAPVNYTIAVNASPSAGGTVTGGGTYPAGTTITLRADANPSYAFVNFTNGSTVVSTSSTYSFTTSTSVSITANFAPIGAVGTQLGNISTRLSIASGDNVAIAGFIVEGSVPKKLLIRARGPSLAPFGIANPVTNPTLELHDANQTIARNDDWQTTQVGGVIGADQVAEIRGSSLAPTAATEAAMIVTLSPGNYTAIVQDTAGRSGVGIVEVFDLEPGSASRLVNISTRGLIEANEKVMIGGFIVVERPTKVLLRARGPSLAPFGIANPLPNPRLELHDSSQTIAQNDDWRITQLGPVITADQSAEIANSSLAPSAPTESAMIVTLQPGSYTVIVQDTAARSGVGIVEVFQFE